MPRAGRLELVVVKPRFGVRRAGVPAQAFTQTRGELPRRARCTIRLRTALLTAVIDQGQPVAQVAQDYGVAWWTAQRCVNTAAVGLPDVDGSLPTVPSWPLVRTTAPGEGGRGPDDQGGQASGSDSSAAGRD